MIQLSATDATRRHDPQSRGFASDNYAGAHPQIMAALELANGGHQPAYGADVYTEHLQQVIRRHFGDAAVAFPVFNGTGANVVALQALLPRWGAVIAASTSHIHVDECGAPEKMAGIKLHTVETPHGKLTPEAVDEQAFGWGDVHRAQPLAVSISQSTELGTVYTTAELREICDHAHERGMLVHMDGARLANAAASLCVPLKAMTADVGVDVVSFGGTKNGLLFGEAVIVPDPERISGIEYLRKMSLQLASKMRFVSVQFEALLTGDLWLFSAMHANAMARRLEQSIRHIEGLEIVHPVEANAVFARLPEDVTARLQKKYRFYVWDPADGQVRWMCAFDTTPADIAEFSQAVEQEMRSEADPEC